MRYGVLGAGAAGLTAAFRLSAAGNQVTVFDRELMPGGLAAGFDIAGASLEKFYHHLFKTDRTIIALIDELGLGDKLVWRQSVTSVFLGGEEHRLNSAGSLLRFGPLSIFDRIRMGAVLAYLKALWRPEALEGITASAWLRSRMGKRAYETVWRPQQEAKFGSMADAIAATWFWSRIRDRTTSLGYLRGGFQQLYDRLAEEATARGASIRLGVDVAGVTRRDDSLLVETDAGAEKFDRVISTLPTRTTCKLARDLPDSYRAQYDWGEAYGAHCVILSMDRQFMNAYWLSILDEGFPFMAAVEHTNYMPPEDYGGRRLLYLGTYRPMNDPIFTREKESLVAEYVPFLRRINRSFEESWIQESWQFGAPYAQPIVTVDFKNHIPPHETPVKGLYLANMFQVYPHDRGQNYSVELANQLSQQLLGG